MPRITGTWCVVPVGGPRAQVTALWEMRNARNEARMERQIYDWGQGWKVADLDDVGVAMWWGSQDKATQSTRDPRGENFYCFIFLCKLGGIRSYQRWRIS